MRVRDIPYWINQAEKLMADKNVPEKLPKSKIEELNYEIGFFFANKNRKLVA